MATEIERKFLLTGDGWRKLSVRQERLRDGLVASTADRKVRVRIYDSAGVGRATLTVKTGTGARRNAEFEYAIPVADAEALLARHCGDMLLTKTRHYVPHEGFIWEIDVYEGLLDGVVMAEVELPREDIEVPLPSWVGREVTGDPDYKKINLQKTRLAARTAGS
jgi:adenylate cyclase